MSSIWLTVIVGPLVVFIVSQMALIFYGERIKNWSSQRSVERMTKRIKTLKEEIEEARDISQGLRAEVRILYKLLFYLFTFLPSVMVSVLLSLITIMGNLIGESSLKLSSVPNIIYFASQILLIVGLVLTLYIWWRVFYDKGLTKIIHVLGNSSSFEEFETKSNQTIRHLEGRIKRVEK